MIMSQQCNGDKLSDDTKHMQRHTMNPPQQHPEEHDKKLHDLISASESPDRNLTERPEVEIFICQS